MPQNSCFSPYFLSEAKNVSINTSAFTVSAKVGAKIIPNTERPFVPIVAAEFDLSGGYRPIPLANAIAFPNMYINMAKECRTASINYAQDNVAAITQIYNGNFRGYLYKKTFDNIPEYNRFLYIYNMVQQFWVNANPLWTNNEYYNNIIMLMQRIAEFSDKNLFIPNGLYDLDNLSDFGVDYIALKAAYPATEGIICVELYL